MSPADETVALVEQAGGQALAVKVDVADGSSTRAMAQAAWLPELSNLRALGTRLGERASFAASRPRA